MRKKTPSWSAGTRFARGSRRETEIHCGFSIKWERLELNLGENIRIGELAGLLHVDRCYLRTLFCAEEGVSPKEYLMRLRLDRAKELLLDGKISVTEVGAEIGFGDVLAFSRFFRSRTGISPSEYRKKREEST